MKTFFRVFGFAPNAGMRFLLYGVYMLLGVIFSAFNLALLMPLLKVLFRSEDAQQIVPPGDFSFCIDHLVDTFNY